MARYIIFEIASGRITNVVDWNGDLAIWRPPLGQNTALRNDGNPGDTFNAGAGTITPAPSPPDTSRVTAIAVGASPFVFQNNGASASIIVSGGTVSLLEFSRNGAAFFTVGLLAGMYSLLPNDRLRVTYTLAPTMTRVPA